MKTKETSNLKELAEIWMAMERKTFDQRKKAEKYYEENLIRQVEQFLIKLKISYVKD